VRRRHRDPVSAVHFVGADAAQPAPEVVESIQRATAILLAPSNPITSIGPILAVPGIRDALRQTAAPVLAISPIVGDAAVSGPAGALMAAQGLPVSASGVAQACADFLDILVVDSSDAKFSPPAGLQVHATNIIMKSYEERTALARTVLSVLREPQVLKVS